MNSGCTLPTGGSASSTSTTRRRITRRFQSPVLSAFARVTFCATSSERVVAGCMVNGLGKGDGFAVDASVMEANADVVIRVPGDFAIVHARITYRTDDGVMREGRYTDDYHSEAASGSVSLQTSSPGESDGSARCQRRSKIRNQRFSTSAARPAIRPDIDSLMRPDSQALS